MLPWICFEFVEYMSTPHFCLVCVPLAVGEVSQDRHRGAFQPVPVPVSKGERKRKKERKKGKGRKNNTTKEKKRKRKKKRKKGIKKEEKSSINQTKPKWKLAVNQPDDNPQPVPIAQSFHDKTPPFLHLHCPPC